MKKNTGMGWFIADVVISLITGIGGILGLLTSYKSSQVQQELMDMHLEEKYGLTAVKED